MENQLYRKESLDRISSPEELHAYMRVTSPRLWMILTAVVILLAGFVAYASMTKLENTMSIKVIAESYDELNVIDDEVTVTGRKSYYYTLLPESLKSNVTSGMEVRIGDAKGKISLVAMVNDDVAGAVMRIMIEMDDPKTMLPDGEYDATLVVETTTPISFLWN